jgi:GT2 family glycosyltransferase
MSGTLPDITISIINTNNREMTLQCLEAVFGTAGDLNLQVIVVNNASKDGSTTAIQERFPCVEIIEQEYMSGFSTNNNLAFARANGKYLLMLNDDTIVHQDAFQKMVYFLETHPEAGAIGPKLLNEDGSWQVSFGYKPNPVYEGLSPLLDYVRPRKPTERPLAVENVSGACMLVRAEIAREIGYLDTRFDPIYSEEIDWCYRMITAGIKIYYLPDAVVTHLGGSTMDRESTQRLIWIFEKKAVFFRKHYRKSSVFIYKASLMVGTLIKLIYWATQWGAKRNDDPDKLVAHWKLLKRSLSM